MGVLGVIFLLSTCICWRAAFTLNINGQFLAHKPEIVEEKDSSESPNPNQKIGFNHHDERKENMPHLLFF